MLTVVVSDETAEQGQGQELPSNGVATGKQPPTTSNAATIGPSLPPDSATVNGVTPNEQGMFKLPVGSLTLPVSASILASASH